MLRVTVQENTTPDSESKETQVDPGPEEETNLRITHVVPSRESKKDSDNESRENLGITFSVSASETEEDESDEEDTPSTQPVMRGKIPKKKNIEIKSVKQPDTPKPNEDRRGRVSRRQCEC